MHPLEWELIFNWTIIQSKKVFAAFCILFNKLSKKIICFRTLNKRNANNTPCWWCLCGHFVYQPPSIWRRPIFFHWCTIMVAILFTSYTTIKRPSWQLLTLWRPYCLACLAQAEPSSGRAGNYSHHGGHIVQQQQHHLAAELETTHIIAVILFSSSSTI